MSGPQVVGDSAPQIAHRWGRCPILRLRNSLRHSNGNQIGKSESAMKFQLVIRADQRCAKIQDARKVGSRRSTPLKLRQCYCAPPELLASGKKRVFVLAAGRSTRLDECTPGTKGEGDGDVFVDDCPRKVPPETREQGSNAETLPSVAENVASISASFMVLYCLLPFPGSVYAGLAWRDDIVQLMWQVFHLDAIASSSLMLKYNTLGQAPALLHALPGAIWCALLPGQLAQAKQPTPGHAVRGRLMLTAAAVLMVGYALIDANGLTAEDYDYGGESGFIAELIDRTSIMQQLGTTFDHLGLKVREPLNSTAVMPMLHLTPTQHHSKPIRFFSPLQ